MPVDMTVLHFPLQKTIHQLTRSFLLKHPERVDDFRVLNLRISDFLLQRTSVSQRGRECGKPLWPKNDLLLVVIGI